MHGGDHMMTCRLDPARAIPLVLYQLPSGETIFGMVLLVNVRHEIDVVIFYRSAWRESQRRIWIRICRCGAADRAYG